MLTVNFQNALFYLLRSGKKQVFTENVILRKKRKTFFFFSFLIDNSQDSSYCGYEGLLSPQEKYMAIKELMSPGLCGIKRSGPIFQPVTQKHQHTKDLKRSKEMKV